MDIANPAPDETTRAPRPETEAERQHRLAREADARDAPAIAERRRRLTLEGLADVDAGRLIDDEAMQAWADSLGIDHELPVPQPG
jgi:predicted transcriptional regulator